MPDSVLKALGTDLDTQLYLYEVVGAYWRPGSYLGEQPSKKLVGELRKPTVAIAKAEGWRVIYEQVNPRRAGATCRERYEGYKSSATIAEAVGRHLQRSEVWVFEAARPLFRGARRAGRGSE